MSPEIPNFSRSYLGFFDQEVFPQNHKSTADPTADPPAFAENDGPESQIDPGLGDLGGLWQAMLPEVCDPIERQQIEGRLVRKQIH